MPKCGNCGGDLIATGAVWKSVPPQVVMKCERCWMYVSVPVETERAIVRDVPLIPSEVLLAIEDVNMAVEENNLDHQKQAWKTIKAYLGVV